MTQPTAPPSTERTDRPRHIAFVNHFGFGHVLPTLETVTELIRRGHRVTYVTSGGPVAKVAATGARVLEYESVLAQLDLAALNNARDGVKLLAINLRESERILATVSDALVADPPDLVVYDVTVYHAGRILARKLGVPAATSCPSFLSNEHFSLVGRMAELAGHRHSRRHPALMELHHGLLALLAEHGQSDVPIEQFMAKTEGLNLAYHPRSFQFAGHTFDDRYAFLGQGVDDTAPTDTSWTPPADGRPVLLVSLGTSNHRRPGFYRTCLAAFAELPWHVVLATHDSLDPAELDPLPPNVEVRRWVPYAAVLPHASVFLCHGGTGSLMMSMSYGTPVLVVADSLDDLAGAERVTELGLGRMLAADARSPEQLRAAVLEVAADPVIAERVRAMRDDLRQAGGGRRGADEIESYLERYEATEARLVAVPG